MPAALPFSVLPLPLSSVASRLALALALPQSSYGKELVHHLTKQAPFRGVVPR